ncbi:hypothetical protein [Burkholderia mayonis]|uniref:Uncharacterized protein n=1 Tax=Burkholderia mayonis TaxID=1385591 RepID=A0A1B4G7U2_9BURK|nr:hypothetical protein [Burkholderia mayonis]AOJ11987.1 hypothetical protein WS71_27275 [Burkholderia mayonis]KVE58050.1 hypothetical protein WS71_25560 [Burkholderia mayonis]
MSESPIPSRQVDYEGFEIHVSPALTQADANRYTYTGYVCHPGADPKLPGHTVPFHADGEESFRTADEAFHEAVSIGCSIVDGTHPDLSVLSLVTRGY